MAQFTGFEELQQQISVLADRFEKMSQRRGRENAKQAIADGIERAMEERIVPDAKANVPEGDWSDHHHGPGQINANDIEGERESPGHMRRSIDHRSVGWSGDTYEHLFGSTSPYEYVRVQEFGTNRSNYTITPNGNYPLSFDWNGQRVAFQYVVHPGVNVPQPGPMQRALKQNTKTVEGFVGNEMREMIERGLD